MRVAILIDNHSRGAKFVCEHGLSVYIEIGSERYLFDTGQTDKFVTNANTLGIDLHNISCAVISHGHYDHAGGLKTLLEIAPQTPVALNILATKPKYSVSSVMTKPNGFPNKEILSDANVLYIKNIQNISEHLTLFTLPYSAPINNHLMIDSATGLCADPFDDEIFALISEHEKHVIYGGCTHHGLDQLFDFCRNQLCINKLSAFIGGLHLSGRSEHEIAQAMDAAQKIDVEQWIINHCSGDDAIKEWQKKFGCFPEYGFAGSIFEI